MNVDPASAVDQLLTQQEEIIGQRDNPLLRSARAGLLSKGSLLRMVQADLWCMEAETVAYAVLLARFPSGPAGDLFAELNSALRSLRPGLDACAQDLGAPSPVPPGLSQADGALSFPMAVSWVCLHAERAAAALALRADFAAYARECRELVRTLTDAGMRLPDAFRDYYDMPTPSKLLDLAAAAVEDGIRRGDSAERAVSVSRLLVEGLDGFWRFAAGPQRAPAAVGAASAGGKGSRACE
ncbi:hypothetical protein [Streptomyces sp. NPDC056160]|uniref:hypothetical protein n=1 Tax=Streptomyces sp. NPDC056160 TaxID=3345731 RepID=UPI0035D56665